MHILRLSRYEPCCINFCIIELHYCSSFCLYTSLCIATILS